MSLRQPSYGGSHLSRTTVSRPRSWFSLTGCFIVGIFISAGVFLYSLHYTVQISSYFQQSSKLRRTKLSDYYYLRNHPHTAIPTKDEPEGYSYETLNDSKEKQKKNNNNAAKNKNNIEGSDEEYEGYGYESVSVLDDYEGYDDLEGYGYFDEQEEEIKGEKLNSGGKSSKVEDTNNPEEELEGYGYIDDEKEIQEEQSDSQKLNMNHKKPSPVVIKQNNIISTNKATPLENKNNNNKKKKAKKPRDPYNFVKTIDPNWGVEGEWDLSYIKVLPTKKPPIKKDRRVVFPSLTPHSDMNRLKEAPSGILGQPRELLKANKILEKHPLYHNIAFNKHEHTLEDVMYYIKNSPSCIEQPVYLTMATVGDDLYWQLIENFVYTLVKFEVSDCSLVICVSDLKCMKMCEDAKFPCFNYVAKELPLPSVMEQIAQVKLLHVPQALTRGVDVFMLDLDVGFLESPRQMVRAFVETPIVDIFVQEDYIFIMNRSEWVKNHRKVWFTEPLPNIGMFLCRGNNRTARVFELAWNKYLGMKDPYEKSQPGKDQNHVLDSMRIGRGTFGLKFAYFSSETAPLLDKLVYREGHAMELGGEAIQGYLDDKHSMAMHTTCYEKSTKVMGLKAANAFWNPRYYDPLRPTITKQLLYLSDDQLLDEVRSLVWLALVTERSLILPNILGSEQLTRFQKYREQVMWPGFRVTFLKSTKGKNELKVQILEPAYYWRIQRDYDPIPVPNIVYYKKDDNLIRVKERMERIKDQPRVVLMSDLPVYENTAVRHRAEEELRVWANDSVGIFPQPYSVLQPLYQQLPSVKGIRAVKDVQLVEEVLKNMRNCNNVFGKTMGSRTCFQVCD